MRLTGFLITNACRYDRPGIFCTVIHRLVGAVFFICLKTGWISLKIAVKNIKMPAHLDKIVYNNMAV